LTAELRSQRRGDGEEWSEWRWTGTRSDGSALDMAGVIVAGIRDGRITWGRLYVESVEAADESIDAAVSRMAGVRPTPVERSAAPQTPGARTCRPAPEPGIDDRTMDRASPTGRERGWNSLNCLRSS
jgi:hypothetical protein